MDMDGWQDRLHFSFLGEHVLFGELRLRSYYSFLVASVLTFAICLFERCLTYAISTHWQPVNSLNRSRSGRALWRSTLYGMATFSRLFYMLVSMTFHIGLILVIVTSLAAGQFVIEYLDGPTHDPQSETADQIMMHEPLLGSGPSSYEDRPAVLESGLTTRPRAKSTKSKPGNIFIHPSASNLARADAFAQQLGIGGDAKDVQNPEPTKAEARANRRWDDAGIASPQEVIGHRRKSSSMYKIGDPDDDDDSTDLSR
ncbi:hypothetical protein BD410DRAFT_783373 [Rickenella mellea]|uniref:Copper transport protein n=1 Tax=Rickenella mellea TaxID=50990 RepID=A0A4Y7QGW1_9AGAM|nr:hypothetical protein BD410DRAFT_783373 [Rickenella mellea]